MDSVAQAQQTLQQATQPNANADLTQFNTPFNTLQNTIQQSTSTYDKSKISTYIVYAVLSIVLIVLIYFAYSKFQENAKGDDNCKDDSKGGSALVADYNLRDEISDINKKQSTIMKRLSSDTGL